ncbi:MAG: DUF937 domain-containing protein [Rhizobiales bacterium]|nr:DUF937 domain-containing protein [Hyphomicrobiales bacterium]
MGLLDDAVNQVAPGGNVAKPLMIALGALLVHKMMSGGGAAAQNSEPTLVPKADAGAATPDGGLLGGLGGLVEKFEKAGQGDTAKSWVGNGPNKPIDPGSLAKAIGPQNVQAAAQQAGVNEQQLLQQLAQNLPGIVDKLTANGSIPSLQQLASAFLKKPGS